MNVLRFLDRKDWKNKHVNEIKRKGLEIRMQTFHDKESHRKRVGKERGGKLL